MKKQREESSDRHVCPVCGCDVHHVNYSCRHDQEEFKVFRCPSCEFLFVRPLFLPALEDRKIDYEYDIDLLNSTSLRKAHETFIIGREIRHVRNILGEGHFSLFDIGCGTGWTTHMWARSGFDASALEPSEARARLAAERYGINVVPGFFEHTDIQDTFDIVIFRHMIEHFADPFEMTVKARSLLNPGGVVLIIVPNINCLGRYLFGTKWTWGIPFHCNFFSPKTLAHLVTRAGFEIITAYQTPSPLLYPESLFRYIPANRQFTAQYNRGLSLLTMMTFAPLIALGYFMNLSENITIIARDKSPYHDAPN